MIEVSQWHLRTVLRVGSVAFGWLLAVAPGVTGVEKVKLQFLWPDYTAEKVRYGEYLVQSFEESHPNVDVEMILTNNPKEKLTVMAAGGAAPDVGWMGAGWLGLEKFWLPLDSYIARDKAEVDQKDILPVLWSTFRVGGEQVAMPSGFTATVTYYNKDMFATAGLFPPQDGWIWEGMVESARKLTIDRTGDGRPDQWGILLTHGGDPWPQLYYGGQLWSEDGRTARFANPARIWAMRARWELEFGVKAHADAQARTALGLQPMFLGGHVAMYAGGSWALEPVRQVNFDWDIVPFPTKVVDGKAYRGTGLWTEEFWVSRTTRHPDEAWQFVKWVTGKPILTWAAREGHIVPGRESVGYSDAFLHSRAKPGNIKAFLESATFAVPFGLHPAWSQISAAITPVLNKAVADAGNPLPPETAAQEIQRLMQAQLDQYWTGQGKAGAR